MAGVVILAITTVFAFGFAFPVGEGWADEIFDGGVILLCPLAIVLAAAVSGRTCWPAAAAVLSMAAGLCASLGQLPLAALLSLGYGVALLRSRAARTGALLSSAEVRHFLRRNLACLCSLAAVLLLFEIWEDLLAPGGLKQFAGEFGGWGLLLSVFLLLVAANLDSLSALCPSGDWPAFRREQSARQTLMLSVLAFVGFIGVNALTRQPFSQFPDHAFSHAVFRCGGDTVSGLMKTISSIGGENTSLYGLPILALTLLLLRRGRALRFYAGVMLGAAAISTTAKALLPRIRPDLVVHRNFDSFPSGHTLSATVLAGVVLLAFLPKCRTTWQRACLWGIAIAWPLLMGASRVYLGRHYLTDVIGGLLLGVAWVAFCRTLLIGAVHLGLDYSSEALDVPLAPQRS